MNSCVACNNTGEYKIPNNKEEFERLFVLYYRPGILTVNECYNKAINAVGYITTPCPYCNRDKK